MEKLASDLRRKYPVIEDERNLSGVVQDGLKRAGMQSDVFAKAQDAAIALGVSGYDALILDLALPDGRGEELLLRLRRRGDTTPVLMILTAEDAVASRIDCLDAGADDYLVEPLDMVELVARIRALLRRPGGALGPFWRSAMWPSTRSAATSPWVMSGSPCRAGSWRSSNI